MLTHPLLWFVWPQVVTNRSLYHVSGELLVCVLETLVLFTLARPVPLLRAAAAAFIANAASYGAGVLARGLGLY